MPRQPIRKMNTRQGCTKKNGVDHTSQRHDLVLWGNRDGRPVAGAEGAGRAKGACCQGCKDYIICRVAQVEADALDFGCQG